MSGKTVKGSWNKWEGPALAGGNPFMPRKPLDWLGTTHATGWGAGVFSPASLPRGERPRRASGAKTDFTSLVTRKVSPTYWDCNYVIHYVITITGVFYGV